MNISSESKIKCFEQYLYKQMGDHCTPGVSIAIINDINVEWVKGYGVCELDTQNAVNELTLFQLGSVSKTLFSYGVMRLVQDGIVSLDEDINHYLKSWKVPKTFDGWMPKVTLRQLLSHTAGFTQIGFMGYKRSEKIPDIKDILNGAPCSRISPIIVDTMPGLQYKYSGGGYTVAELVITDILGIPFSQFMENKVLKPLSMHNSCYEHPLSLEKEGLAAHGYRWNYIPVEGGWNNMPILAAGGLWSCPDDLAKFGIELQNAVRGESDLLKREYATEMITPQIEDHYGLGIRIKGEGQTQHLYHYGGNQGFMSVLMLYRHLGKGAAITINSNHEEILDDLLIKIASLYEWPCFMLNEMSMRKIPIIELIGSYRLQAGVDIQITINENGFLLLKYGIQEPKMLTSPMENKCIMRPLNTEVEFIKNKSGRIELAIVQDFKKHFARKVG
jgi:CubicO group peptidase (beta-lactamase class C family)